MGKYIKVEEFARFLNELGYHIPNEDIFKGSQAVGSASGEIKELSAINIVEINTEGFEKVKTYVENHLIYHEEETIKHGKNKSFVTAAGHATAVHVLREIKRLLEK